MKLENKTAQIIVTKIYEHDLCDCCCDHPDDVLNFVDYKEDFVKEEIKVKIIEEPHYIREEE